MKLRAIPTLLCAGALLLAPSMFSQQQADRGNVARIYWSWARAGQVAQYEAGNKRHNEFHRQKNDPWTWQTWQVVSGNRGAQYVIGSFWHHWKDFDNTPVTSADDEADYLKNVEPYEANWRGEHLVFMPNHSLPPDSTDPYPVYVLWHVQLKPGMTDTYLSAVAKIPEAARKAGVDWRYTFWMVADGNVSGSYYISFPYKSWGERDAQGLPFEEVLIKAYGREEAHSMQRAFDQSVASTTSMVLTHRPDLSYVPANPR